MHYEGKVPQMFCNFKFDPSQNEWHSMIHQKHSHAYRFNKKKLRHKKMPPSETRVFRSIFFSVYGYVLVENSGTRERGKTTFETLPILEIPPSHAALPILLMEDIRRSPVEVLVVCPLFTGNFTSQVVQDFFHQPYL